MARPYKNIELTSGKIGKEKIQARVNAENALKGKCDKIKPIPELNLTAGAKKIFYKIKKELEPANILTNVDSYILSLTAKAIYKIGVLEDMYNKETNIKNIKTIQSMINVEEKNLQKYFADLCLNPQSRAKIGAIKAEAKEEQEDPLNKLLALRGKNVDIR